MPDKCAFCGCTVAVFMATHFYSLSRPEPRDFCASRRDVNSKREQYKHTHFSNPITHHSICQPNIAARKKNCVAAENISIKCLIQSSRFVPMYRNILTNFTSDRSGRQITIIFFNKINFFYIQSVMHWSVSNNNKTNP